MKYIFKFKWITYQLSKMHTFFSSPWFVLSFYVYSRCVLYRNVTSRGYTKMLPVLCYCPVWPLVTRQHLLVIKEFKTLIKIVEVPRFWELLDTYVFSPDCDTFILTECQTCIKRPLHLYILVVVMKDYKQFH